MFEWPVKYFSNFLSFLSRDSGEKTPVSGNWITSRCSMAGERFTIFWNLKSLAVAAFCLACSQYSPAAEYIFGEYTISINSNVASILSKNDYTVSVSVDGLTLSRLTVACDYENIRTFVADLDFDSRFEVIVVSGKANNRLDAFTWTGYALEKFDISTEVENKPSVTILQRFYEVKNNKLVQQFKVSKQGNRSGPNRMTYVYSAITKRWVLVAD